jgi:hypothetical protein
MGKWTEDEVRMMNRRSEETERRMAAVLEEHRESFEQLFAVAVSFFAERVTGQTFTRRPSLTLTLPFPGEPPARVVLRPAWNATARTVNPERVGAEVLVERIEVGQTRLRSREVTLGWFFGEIRLAGWSVTWGAESMARAAAVAADFLVDPFATFSRSSDHCCICRRVLKDALSRARGIGPECLRYMDVFRRMVEGQLIAEQVVAANPGQAAAGGK